MMKKMLSPLLLTVSALVVVAPFITTQAEDAPATAPAPQPVPETIVVKSASSGGSVVLGGTVIPIKTVNLSAQMPGEVLFVSGEEGDAFREGDQLVALDTSKLMQKRKQAETQLASAIANHRNAWVQYQNELRTPNAQANSMLGGLPEMFSFFSDPMREFGGEGSPDYQRYANLQQMRTGVEAAANQVDQARAGIAELDEALSNAISFAPFDGVIIKKMAEAGDIVQPGMPLITFADISTLQVRAEVPTSLLDIVRQGGDIYVRVNDKMAKATVARVFPMADAMGHTTTVKFDVPANVELHPGMYADVLVPDATSTASSSMPMIPESAIRWRGSLPAVFLYTPEGDIKLRLLRLGERGPNGMISVVSGIKPGDRILKNPSVNMRGGS